MATPAGAARRSFSAVRDYFGEHVAFYFAWIGHYLEVASARVGVQLP